MAELNHFKARQVWEGRQRARGRGRIGKEDHFQKLLMMNLCCPPVQQALSLWSTGDTTLFSSTIQRLCRCRSSSFPEHPHKLMSQNPTPDNYILAFPDLLMKCVFATPGMRVQSAAFYLLDDLFQIALTYWKINSTISTIKCLKTPRALL